MDWESKPWQPPAPPFRIDFRLTSGLSPGEREAFLMELVSEPFQLDEAKVESNGRGWVLYSETSVDVGERDQVETWLRAHRLVRDVTVKAVGEE